MSLTSDDLADIKQLMQAVVSQSLAVHKQEIIDEMDKRFEQADRRFEEMDDKLDAILDAVGSDMEAQDEKIVDLNRRVTRLEAQAA